MPDITMCSGLNCPLKEKCYRCTAPINPYRQSFFAEVPYKDGKCDQFISNQPYNEKNNNNDEFSTTEE